MAVKKNVVFPWLGEGSQAPPKVDDRPEKPLEALILCPTRELAIQVKDHIQRIIRHTSIMVSSF